MKNKGDVPVPYIIAIILGLIVIGGLIYIFLGQTKQTPKEACNAKMGAFCSLWAISRFDPNQQPGGSWTNFAGSDCVKQIPPNQVGCAGNEKKDASGNIVKDASGNTIYNYPD